nr:hypothetical protein Iba_chr12bCG16230 [Ipomoea batatas]
MTKQAPTFPFPPLLHLQRRNENGPLPIGGSSWSSEMDGSSNGEAWRLSPFRTMGVAVEFQQASLGYLSVSGENATQQRHDEASSHLPVSPASPSSTTEREWTSTPRRQFVELGDGRQQQR